MAIRYGKQKWYGNVVLLPFLRSRLKMFKAYKDVSIKTMNKETIETKMFSEYRLQYYQKLSANLPNIRKNFILNRNVQTFLFKIKFKI